MNKVLLLFFLFLTASLTVPQTSRNSDSQSVSNKRTVSKQSRDDQVLPLTWSKYELNQISGITGGSYYYGKDATESRFKQELSSFKILHIASHTFINDSDPDLSYISFSTEDNTEDGHLNVFEIYNQKINAEMIILSSCNTGLGKIITGEGALSLARAFMYAGCPSIIMSLWDIDDRATSEVVVKFYQKLLEGKTKDESLREAKLNYLREADQYTANPLYWGGLVSIGNQVNTKIERGKYDWNLPVSIAISLLLLGIFIQRILHLRRVKISTGQTPE